MINGIFGWFWITIGFVAGMILGMKFRHDDWLGGYSAFPRRLVRLGHISFIGLGFVNILFAHSVVNLPANYVFSVASLVFIGGAITMPTCCFLAAWQRNWLFIFSIPIILLVLGGCLTLIGLISR